jgi:hypothetical protein
VKYVDPDGKTPIGRAGIERMVASIDRTLNNAWSRSFSNGEWTREWGGTVARSLFGGYSVSSLRTDHNPGSVDINPPMLRSTVAEFHTHPEGVPFSNEDVTAMFHKNTHWDISIIEAGTERFALEITDRRSFDTNLNRNSNRFEETVASRLRQGDSRIDSHLYALRELSHDPDSGITVYRSIDSNKLRFEEL